MIVLIAAIGQDNEIGINGEMPWNIPSDLKMFKKITSGHTVVMGRKTFESIGRPLSNRDNIVLTSKPENVCAEITAVRNVNAVLYANDMFDTIKFIIGGGEIYKQFLPHADAMIINHVYGEFPLADTFFPEFTPSDFPFKNLIMPFSEGDMDSHATSLTVYGKKEETYRKLIEKCL